MIILLALFFIGPALFPFAGKIIYGGDLLTQFFYWKGFLAQNIKSGIIPFWNPYIFSGTPFLAHPAVAAFYPFTLFFIIFPLNQSFSLFIAVHLCIAGLGMYQFSRHFSTKFGALVSAITFAYGGYFAARIYAGHIDLLSTAAWIPWVIAAMLDIFQKGFSKRRLIKSVAVWSMLILAGYSAYLVFTAMFMCAFALHYIIVVKLQKDSVIDSFKRVGIAFATLLIALLITGVQWLPTWELTKNSIRGDGLPYDVASWGSLPVSGLKLFINPLNRNELNKIVFNLGGGPLPNPFDHFIGTIPLIIVIVFLLFLFVPVIAHKEQLTKLKRDIGFFTLTSLVFVWIAFSYNVPINLHGILYSLIPLYRYIRMPIQHLIIPIVLVSLLAGIAVSQVKYRALQVAALMLIITEIFAFGKQYIFLTSTPDAVYDQKLISYLKDKLNDKRLLPHYRVVSPVLSDFGLNSAVMYGISTTSGYDPVILANYYNYIDRMNGAKISSIVAYNVEIPPIELSPRIISDLTIGYILEEKSYDRLTGQNELYTKVLEGNTYNLYEIVQPPLRFKIVKTESDCMEKNVNTVVIKESLNSIKITLNSDCAGQLISTDTYYPGWKVKLDGRPEKILLSNNLFRTINLSKGTHVLEFYYYPRIYIIGLLFSLSGIISALFMGFIYKPHAKRKYSL